LVHSGTERKFNQRLAFVCKKVNKYLYCGAKLS